MPANFDAPEKQLSMLQVLACGAAIVTLSMGICHGFGLWLGQWLHVGKNATMGLGAYALEGS